MKVLTIVVPIASYSTRYENLLKWISACQDNRIEIVICYDRHGSDESNFIKDFEGIRSRNSRIIEGTFLSPGSARNAGLDQAIGDWIIFCDSDDNVNVESWDEFITGICDYSSSTLVAFNFSVTDSKRKIAQFKFSKKSHAMAFGNFATIPGLWRLCFNRRAIGSTRFTNIRLGEDILFLIEFLSLGQRITYSNLYFYTYFVAHENQLTRTAHQRTEYIKVMDKLMEENRILNMGSRILLQIFLIRILKSAVCKPLDFQSDYNKYMKFIWKEIGYHPISTSLSLASLLIFSRRLKPLLTR